jgi:hypothetical protein
LRADWAIVCGESTPLSGVAIFGGSGVVGRPAGGV